MIEGYEEAWDGLKEELETEVKSLKSLKVFPVKQDILTEVIKKMESLEEEIMVQNMKTVINVADLVDPSDEKGRTYRQINVAKKHSIPIGELVEIKSGERLRVINHTRDCDQEPLYTIGIKSEDDNLVLYGYGEGSLKVVGEMK